MFDFSKIKITPLQFRLFLFVLAIIIFVLLQPPPQKNIKVVVLEPPVQDAVVTADNDDVTTVPVEQFNFFARDADIVLRGRYVNPTLMTPTGENRSKRGINAEENRLRLQNL